MTLIDPNQTTVRQPPAAGPDLGTLFTRAFGMQPPSTPAGAPEPRGGAPGSTPPRLVAQAAPGSAAATPLAIVELDPATAADTHNVLRLPDPLDIAGVIGVPLPNDTFFQRIPGIGGAPAVYAIGNRSTLTPGSGNFLDPTVFIGIPLDAAGVNAATFASAANVVLQGGPVSDVLATTLFNRYQMLSNYLNRAEVRASLPPGVRVVPQIVLTMPASEVAGLATEGLGSSENAQVGIGLAFIYPKHEALIFTNARIDLAQLREAVEQGGDMPDFRTLTLGTARLNTDVGNVGAAYGLRVENYDPERPGAIQLGGGIFELPQVLDGALDVLTGTVPGYEILPQDWGPLFERLGVDPEQFAGALDAIDRGMDAVGILAQLGAIAATFAKNPLAGGILAFLGLMEADAALTDQIATGLVERGEYDPAVSIPRILEDAPITDMIIFETYHLTRGIDRAVETGVAGAEELLEKWRAAADPSPGDPDSIRRAMIANLVLGNYQQFLGLSQQIGDPAANYSGDIEFALRDVGSTALQEVTEDVIVDETAPDGSWRKIRLRLVEDDAGEVRYVALKASDNSQFYELPAEANGTRAEAIAYVERAIETGQMNDSFVADPPRGSIAAMIRMPLEDDAVNGERMLDLVEQWLAANPTADLSVINDFLVDRYNEPGVSDIESANIGYLYALPMFAPARALNETIFRTPDDKITIPASAEGPDDVFAASEIGPAIAARREQLGPAEFSRRIDALAEQLYTLGWPMNFGSPELAAALRALEAERGPIAPSPIFQRYGDRYR